MESWMSGNGFPNPMKRKGPFFGFIEALKELGIDKVHSYSSVMKRMKEIMTAIPVKCSSYSNAWDAFVNKKTKNSLCARDFAGKIIENAILLQRLNGFHPYGEKLRQINSAICIYKGEGPLPYFELKTTFTDYDQVAPINEFKRAKPLRVEIG